jgi:serine/threonine protein kinase
VISEGKEAILFQVLDENKNVFALKRFPSDDPNGVPVNKEKILNENTISTLDPKHIVKYLDIFEIDGYHYSLMKYYENQDLRSFIDKNCKEHTVTDKEVCTLYIIGYILFVRHY